MMTILAFVELEDDAAGLRAAGALRGDELGLVVCGEVTEVLVALERRWPDVLLLDLAEREEEVALLCRAARKRATVSGRPLRIVLVDRGASLVEDAEEARALGADQLLAAGDSFEALLARVVPAVVESAPENGAVRPSRPTVPAPFAPVSSQRTLDDLLQLVRHGHYFAILGVAPDAETPDIAEAHVTLRQQLAATRVDSTSATTHARLDEIEQGVADAWHILGDARLRRQYREALRAYRAARQR